MTKPLPRITQEQRMGVRKLLVWCINKYKNSYSPLVKRMWYERKEFLSELQKKQSYDTNDRDEYNRIRELYYLDKRYE
jgi:GTPase SAR1 family protein